MSAIFCLSKTRQNKQVTVASSFNPSKSHQKCQKRYNEITSIFQLQKLYRKKYVETTLIFRLSKLRGKKYVETASIFYPSKLYRGKYAEMTSIFRPSKLRERQYVGAMQIFHPSKLRSRKYVKMMSISVKILSEAPTSRYEKLSKSFSRIVFVFALVQNLRLRFLKLYFKLEILIFLSIVVSFLSYNLVIKNRFSIKKHTLGGI